MMRRLTARRSLRQTTAPMRRLAGAFLILLGAAANAAAAGSASLTPARDLQCQAVSDCSAFDAIVFVHGIYGSADTFRNPRTGFDWPRDFPRRLQVGDENRRIDVFRLEYRTTKLSWAKDSNPDFVELAADVEAVMQPLRLKQYRSIGFVAHSLGGNVISTYLHGVKTKYSHPARSRHGYVITLATPVLGSQIADVLAPFKRELGMTDRLIESLRTNNLFLKILNEWRGDEADKASRAGCRPVHLHVAFEEQRTGPVTIVRPGSAALPVAKIVNSPVVGFERNHLAIAKPSGANDEVFQWVEQLVLDELDRMATWDVSHAGFDPQYRLCERMMPLPEP